MLLKLHQYTVHRGLKDIGKRNERNCVSNSSFVVVLEKCVSEILSKSVER